MKPSRSGMTLFELLIVVMIVGIVYSIAIFTLNKEKVSASKIDLSTLRSTMGAFEHRGAIRMVCDSSCRECRVWTADDKPVATLHLSSDGSVKRYGFDHNGDLRELEKSVSRIQDSLVTSCFEYTLNADGTASALILKDNRAFYAYTPLQDGKPFITADPEALRRFMSQKERYPMKRDDYYAGQ